MPLTEGDEEQQKMRDMLIDTHTHLDDDVYDDDRSDVIAASREAGVRQWINVGYSPERWSSTLDMAGRTDGMQYMLGMHPGHADEWTDQVAAQLASLVDRFHPVAIGEIGLDLHWRQDNLSRQVEILERQLGLALSVSLPAVIHMRSADAELLEVLRNADRLPHLHFHSFDGGEELRDYVLEHDCTIGVGGLMTRKGSASLRRWITEVPRHMVVLETDSPYLKPQGIRGRRNQPSYMIRVADRLAELWDAPRSEVDLTTTANAQRIFTMTNGHD